MVKDEVEIAILVLTMKMGNRQEKKQFLERS